MSSEKCRYGDTAGHEISSGHEGLRLIRGLVRFHRAMSIAEYPRNAGVRRFMELTGREAADSRQNREKGAVRPLLSDAERRASAESILASLQQEIISCTGCHLAASRLGSVPGRGRIGCRLMVVGDWSSQEDQFSGEVVFGPEEDAMLWKMMAAIGLAPEEVYVTNSIKCCPAGEKKPDSACATSCFSYLSREIGLIRPPVVCAMGEIAARTLTGRKDQLVRMRGRFLGCRHDPSVSPAVMPTFHPRFLLRNPEMKKAVWRDLQSIKRRLEGKSN